MSCHHLQRLSKSGLEKSQSFLQSTQRTQGKIFYIENCSCFEDHKNSKPFVQAPLSSNGDCPLKITTAAVVHALYAYQLSRFSSIRVRRSLEFLKKC